MTLDHWRPRLHFAPQRHWINDPNGLIWHEGEYHLFFQTNPHGETWGHMSWGHAVSRDLMHWQELPVAIPEDDDWMIFSGSVVADHANSSGFGEGGVVPLVAIYTGCAQRPGPDGKTHRQNQQLAFSLDRGRTWTKFAGNPVLDLGSSGFRDPKVFWHAASHRWIMLVSMADEGWLRFFASSDLKTWEALSEFRHDMPGCSVWECPDLLELPIQGEAGSAWLLKWDVFRGHPGGGSGALGVVGHFDGVCFQASQPPQWLDGGMDFYAAIAFGAMPPGDARRVWLGWMNSHHYGQHTPTAHWRGAMTLPREVTLLRDGETLRVAQAPARELLCERGESLWVIASDTPVSEQVLVPMGKVPCAFELEIDIEALGSDAWALELSNTLGDTTSVTVGCNPPCVSITRDAGGMNPGVSGFSGTRSLPWPGAGAPVVGLRVVVDACSVEVFSADGTAVLTEQIFPRPSPKSLRLQAHGQVRVLRCQWWALGA